MGRRWYGWGSLLFAGIVLAGPGGKAASPAREAQDLAGVWDLSGQDRDAKCRIVLRLEPSNGARQKLTIPPACLKNFPDLASADAWAATGDGHLDLLDKTSGIVLDFVAEDTTSYTATGPEGEVYRLSAIQGAPKKSESAAQQRAAAPAAAAAIAVKQQDVPVSSDAAGRYSILRDGGKDTGCMLTLDAQTKAPGGKKATLAPGCRDQGVVIFDPVGWQIVNGRLVLTARKGHQTHLDAQPNGIWKKDPAEGKGLSLKKL